MTAARAAMTVVVPFYNEEANTDALARAAAVARVAAGVEVVVLGHVVAAVRDLFVATARSSDHEPAAFLGQRLECVLADLVQDAAGDRNRRQRLVDLHAPRHDRTPAPAAPDPRAAARAF